MTIIRALLNRLLTRKPEMVDAIPEPMELTARLIEHHNRPPHIVGLLELEHKEKFSKGEASTEALHAKLLALDGVQVVRYVTPYVTHILCNPCASQNSVLVELLTLREWRWTE